MDERTKVPETEMTPIRDFSAWVLDNFDFSEPPKALGRRATHREFMGFQGKDDVFGQVLWGEYFDRF